MSKTNFVHGTEITPEFLQAINNLIYRANPQNDGEIPYPDLAGMTDVRAAIDKIGTTQIYDVNVTGNAYAKDVRGSGLDDAATTALLRISKITAKSWLLQVQFEFALNTVVAGQPMKWTAHASSAEGSGALIDDLYTALVASGQVPFGPWNWMAPSAGTVPKTWFLNISASGTSDHMLIFTPKNTFAWETDTSPEHGQKNLYATGMLILP